MPVKETIGILSLTFSKFEGICLSYSSTQVATQSGVDLWTSHWKVRERSELKKKIDLPYQCCWQNNFLLEASEIGFLPSNNESLIAVLQNISPHQAICTEMLQPQGFSKHLQDGKNTVAFREESLCLQQTEYVQKTQSQEKYTNGFIFLKHLLHHEPFK